MIYGRVIGTTIGAMDEIKLVPCDGTVIVSSEGFIDGGMVGKFNGLLLGA